MSPPCRYSSELAALGSTQPVPVVVTTPRTSRSKAPVRSSTSPSGPWKARSSAGVVAPATKLRPYSPSVTHGTSDAGLPEAVGVASATTNTTAVTAWAATRGSRRDSSRSRPRIPWSRLSGQASLDA